MNDLARIDVHQHLIPPEFREALGRHGMAGWAPFEWSEAGALAMMDDFGIATGLLSLSTPGPHLGDDLEARELTRRINERIAGMVQRRPDRFGMFASVPLPDIEGSLEAIAYAYDQLSTDGVVLLANTRGTYLGDPKFEPVMAELGRRSAIVSIHPAHLEGRPVPGLHPSLADFLLDTTRSAINLVLQGVTRRYPNIRFILSHAGGFLPYAAHRIATLANVVDPAVDRVAMLEDLSSFYFDTALSGSPTALPSLGAFVRPGHVLFGSDSPYASGKTIGYFTNNLDRFAGLDEAAHTAINRANAEILFPRLALRRHEIERSQS
ncbi:amidohydrolase family protein [Lichenicoccus sp.]|uniref:amidohydrolase family protein n=1 Tax=Lichenicoccus sp. TaxID=2781899 RepID=UPI003D09FA00